MSFFDVAKIVLLSELQEIVRQIHTFSPNIFSFNDHVYFLDVFFFCRSDMKTTLA